MLTSAAAHQSLLDEPWPTPVDDSTCRGARCAFAPAAVVQILAMAARDQRISTAFHSTARACNACAKTT